LHRPLKKYSKKQIKSYAIFNRLTWFDDRSNLELNYTRNKIRNFLYSKKLFNKINKERLEYSEMFHLHQLHKNFFKRKRNNIFEIDTDRFHYLNENLKFFAVQSFYYEHRHLLKKQIRDENINNFLKILKIHIISGKEMSVFSGKIGVFNKKTCINLT
jgi:tRNA(Ile)-lysidine synthase